MNHHNRPTLHGGWLSSARRVISPNFNQRPAGTPVSLLVIHNISLPMGEYGTPYIEQLFTNTLDCKAHDSFESLIGVTVSSHFLIKRDGELVQFVNCDDRAWHAGISNFEGVENCNDYSVGIELEGCDLEAFTDKQYQALMQVTQALLDYYPELTHNRITGHEHIAPGRKTDPGPYFDWERYWSELE